MDKEIEKLEELRNNLSVFEEAKFTSKITLERGRIIKQLKKIINILEKKEDKTNNDIEQLENYYKELNQEVFLHKRQLDDRYNKEFIKAEAKVPDLVTTLPKGMYLQVKKIANTINDYKSSRSNKAKIKSILNFGKEAGILAATPAIFAGKFVIEHWYLLLLLWHAKKNNWYRKNPNKEPELQPEAEPAVEPATEPSVEHVVEPAAEPAAEPVAEPSATPVVEPIVDPVVNSQVEPVVGENIFTVQQQTDYLYDVAIKSYQSDSMGNVYSVYKDLPSYLAEMGATTPEDIEFLTSIATNPENSIRFIVGDHNAYFKTEADFIDAITGGVGLTNVDLSTTTMRDYLSNIETIGNPMNLIGTEYDPYAISSLDEYNQSKLIQRYISEFGTAGVALFILYAAAKYGLAIPTYGATLALP